MSAENIGSHQESPEPGHLEFYLVMSALRSQFDRAKQEQHDNRHYDMFTFVGRQVGNFARIRIADHSLVHDNLQSVTGLKQDYFDVGMPIKEASVTDPELATGRKGARFILFGHNMDGETEQLIAPSNIDAFLEAHPDFVAQSIAYEPIPIRKR